MFECGSDKEHHDHTPNLWPPEESLPNFKQEWMDLFWSLQEINRNMMKTVSLALGQEIDALDYLIDKGDNNFRALYYPAGRKDILDQQVRAGQHTDYGSFTYLFQDDVGGLQVLNHKTQQFQHAPPIKDCCIVNCGDMMERITNKTFTSTLHQVVNPF